MPSHLERLLSAVVALQRHIHHDTVRAACWSADESGCVACLRYDELQDAAMEIARAIDSLRSRVAELEAALQFYADTETYHACAFSFDRPTGGFDKDFSYDHDYGRLMPGKTARAALGSKP